MDNSWVGAYLALSLIFGIFLIVFRLTEGNISESELYRFCMTKNIPLAECKITGELLDGGRK